MNDADQPLLLKRNLNDVFNERNQSRRMQAIQALYLEDAVFYEGEDTYEGWSAICKRFDAILTPTPQDFVFRAVRQPGRIHDLEQLSWELGPSTGQPIASGLDVALIKDRRILALYTFIDSTAQDSNELKP